MTLNDYVNLKELLEAFRKEVDTNYAHQIESVEGLGAESIPTKTSDMLKEIDSVIELVDAYRLNCTLDAKPQVSREQVLQLARQFSHHKNVGKIELIKALRALNPDVSLREAKDRVENMFIFYPNSVILHE